ncbi:MAG: hypothetical protein LBH24_05200 [Clostridiales bacterium]|nr:hypothetical protein [Clostridiales bacterium]
MKNKVKLYKILLIISCILLVIAFFATFRYLYFLILDAVLLSIVIVLGVLLNKWQNIATKNSKISTIESNLADYAFNKLLVAGADYTVFAEVETAQLIKKEVKWAYLYIKNGKPINALFTITTDIKTVAFQLQGKTLCRIDDVWIVTAIYELKESSKEAEVAMLKSYVEELRKANSLSKITLDERKKQISFFKKRIMIYRLIFIFSLLMAGATFVISLKINLLFFILFGLFATSFVISFLLFRYYDLNCPFI